MVPLLIYAQDETGSVTPELIAEGAKQRGVTPLQEEGVIWFDHVTCAS